MKNSLSFAGFCTKLFIVSFLFCLLPTLVTGQAQVEWINVYPLKVYLKDGLIDHDGNLIFIGRNVGVGSSLDLFTIKIDPAGNTVWHASYDSVSRDEQPNAICLDDNNDIYVTGDDYYRGLTFKYSKNGSLIWKVYPGNDGLDNGLDSHSNLYLVGRDDDDVVIRKYDSAGTSLGAFGVDSNYSIPYHIQLNKAGDIFIGGTELITQQEYFYCEKYDSNGILLWHTRYIPNDTVPQNPDNMVLDTESNVYIVATAKKGTEDMYCAMRFGADGNIDWVSFENFGNTFFDWGRDIATDLNGSAYVTGRSFDGTVSSCITLKYDSSGTLLWSDKSPISIPPTTHQKVKFYNGNIYILTPHSGSEGYEFLLRKLNADGDSIWQVTYPGTPYLLIIDSFENVFVSGLDSTGDSTITIKYSQPVGTAELPAEKNSISFFPNPASSSFNIVYTIEQNAILTLTDAYGSVVKQVMLYPTFKNRIVNVDDLPAGVYLVTLHEWDKIISKKMMVSR